MGQSALPIPTLISQIKPTANADVRTRTIRAPYVRVSLGR
jgi:hypothetical protein